MYNLYLESFVKMYIESMYIDFMQCLFRVF